MPCALRLDAPVVLHHVMARGIMRQTIVLGVSRDICDSAGEKSHSRGRCFRNGFMQLVEMPREARLDEGVQRGKRVLGSNVP